VGLQFDTVTWHVRPWKDRATGKLDRQLYASVKCMDGRWRFSRTANFNTGEEAKVVNIDRDPSCGSYGGTHTETFGSAFPMGSGHVPWKGVHTVEHVLLRADPGQLQALLPPVRCRPFPERVLRPVLAQGRRRKDQDTEGDGSGFFRTGDRPRARGQSADRPVRCRAGGEAAAGAFQQRKRLADAERALERKATKTAEESERIATDKVAWALGKLSDLHRSELIDEDSRIYPGHYAPVLVVEDGKRVIKPMRYQCRLPGKPAFYDAKFPGTYNARRDNLEGFWKPLFGRSHGLVLMQAFYENVTRHRMEGRDLDSGEAAENVVLEFRPRPAQDMLVACLWSRWTAPGEPALLSFAAITDEPPTEIAAAGHDRCIVPIRAENIDAWLNPGPKKLADQYAILEDRARPYYDHRLAA
jgi:putative SOS response-associated peptidase YedK